METMEKRWRDACAEQVHIIRPEHINGSGRLFGGQLLMWIDVVARRGGAPVCQFGCYDGLY